MQEQGGRERERGGEGQEAAGGHLPGPPASQPTHRNIHCSQAGQVAPSTVYAHIPTIKLPKLNYSFMYRQKKQPSKDTQSLTCTNSIKILSLKGATFNKTNVYCVKPMFHLASILTHT